MKYTIAVLFAIFSIIGWNAFLIKRDTELFKAYDRVCDTLPQPHPDCQYSK